MQKKPKIVIIGAGSASFGYACIKDAFYTNELWGSELTFVDIDKVALERMVKAAKRINEELNAQYIITSTTERKEALKGADFVIISIAINRNKLWEQDFSVPKKYGINHVLGENGGPGAVFHTMRNIPIILEICKDIEQICPNALLINFTNPESRICLAIKKHTKVRAIGLCHQIFEGIKIVKKIIGREDTDIDIKAMGLNHFTWITDIRDCRTGEDLYPLLEEKEKDFEPEFEALSRYMYKKFGLFPTSGDGHLGKYMPFSHEFTNTKGYDFEEDELKRKKQIDFINNLGEKSVKLDDDVFAPSGEFAFKIIKGITYNTNETIFSVNLPNEGYITNLPEDAIVEVPALVSGNGVRGIGMGAFPDGIAALCTNQINVQKMVVEAGVKGDKNMVLQALLIDPNVPSANAAEGILKELMSIDKRYLPQFE